MWLITVRKDDTPQLSPVWFHWIGASFRIYSTLNKQKQRTIAANSNGALCFDGSGQVGDTVILSGTAIVDMEAPPLHEVVPYVANVKIVQMGMTIPTFAKAYGAAMRVTPTPLRGC